MSLDTANNLVTLAGAKSYLGVTTTDYDTRLTDLVNVVSHQFNSYTGRKLKSRSHTTYLDGNGLQHIYVDQYPISSVSTSISIRIDAERAYTTDTAVNSSDILIYADEGRIELDGETFDAGPKSVKIIYTAGYTLATTSASGTLPADLEYAAKEMLKVVWRREQGGSAGVRNESVEGQSIGYEPSMPWSVKDVLDDYRDVRRG